MTTSEHTYTPKPVFTSENHARSWAKKYKLKVKCVEYLKGGCRLQVANRRRMLTLRVDDLSSE